MLRKKLPTVRRSRSALRQPTEMDGNRRVSRSSPVGNGALQRARSRPRGARRHGPGRHPAAGPNAGPARPCSRHRRPNGFTAALLLAVAGLVAGEAQAQLGSTDATLSGLALEDASDDSTITLTPGFQSGTTGYAASVANEVDKVTVEPTTSDSNAAIAWLNASNATITDADTNKRGQQVALGVGSNTIKVKVTAEDGNTTLTYTLTVTRAAAPVWSTTLTIGVRDATRGYSDSAGGLGSLDNRDFIHQTNSRRVRRVLARADGVFFRINGGGDTFGGLVLEWAGEVLPLDDATNPDGNTDVFTWNQTWLGSNAPSLTAANYEATLHEGGDGIVCLRTASQSCPSTAVYDDDATLSALALEVASDDTDITLAPVFASATTNYTALVANGVDKITVKPTTNDSNATVAWLDASNVPIADADGIKPGQQVALAVGTNTIKIRVTAEDGVTTETYTVPGDARGVAGLVDDAHDRGQIREQGVFDRRQRRRFAAQPTVRLPVRQAPRDSGHSQVGRRAVPDRERRRHVRGAGTGVGGRGAAAGQCDPKRQQLHLEPGLVGQQRVVAHRRELRGDAARGRGRYRVPANGGADLPVDGCRDSERARAGVCRRRFANHARPGVPVRHHQLHRIGGIRGGQGHGQADDERRQRHHRLARRFRRHDRGCGHQQGRPAGGAGGRRKHHPGQGHGRGRQHHRDLHRRGDARGGRHRRDAACARAGGCLRRLDDHAHSGVPVRHHGLHRVGGERGGRSHGQTDDERRQRHHRLARRFRRHDRGCGHQQGRPAGGAGGRRKHLPGQGHGRGRQHHCDLHRHGDAREGHLDRRDAERARAEGCLRRLDDHAHSGVPVRHHGLHRVGGERGGRGHGQTDHERRLCHRRLARRVRRDDRGCGRQQGRPAGDAGGGGQHHQGRGDGRGRQHHRGLHHHGDAVGGADVVDNAHDRGQRRDQGVFDERGGAGFGGRTQVSRRVLHHARRDQGRSQIRRCDLPNQRRRRHVRGAGAGVGGRGAAAGRCDQPRRQHRRIHLEPDVVGQQRAVAGRSELRGDAARGRRRHRVPSNRVAVLSFDGCLRRRRDAERAGAGGCLGRYGYHPRSGVRVRHHRLLRVGGERGGTRSRSSRP